MYSSLFGQPCSKLRGIALVKAVGQYKIKILCLKSGLPQKLKYHFRRLTGIDRADNTDGVIGKLSFCPTHNLWDTDRFI